MKLPQIQSISDYSKLKPNPLQRAFSEKKVADLAAKMSRNGFPPSMAISTYRDKGALVINTGHHRLAAARQAGISALYVVEKKWTPRQLVDEGVSSKAWCILSAAQCFASQGKEDYITMLNYHDKGIPLNMVASMLSGEGAGSGNARKRVVDGEFQIKETAQADTFVDLFMEFAEDQPAVKSRPFIAALSKCLFTPEFDLYTLKKRMKENPAMLGKVSGTEQMLKLIEEIYNFRSAKKIPLAFMVTEHSRARSAAALIN
ncbi:ParB/RepB/Spo0J family partition protein [uncultured Sneathiella sp.]|uniref:ParB/RepB/Spo0J family partition protein n=1 Tax=uncultured Sneathiella sp. TaxID=879315 RepID=UPI0030ECE4B3|tara:strand:- start:378 stop:1154 length:777 start_codon:yes stop_codon:yes gene_type:complete